MRFRFMMAWLLFMMPFAGVVTADDLRLAHALRDDGNVAEAYDVYTNVVFHPATLSDERSRALGEAVSILPRLNRVKESDALLEAAARNHADDAFFLSAIASLYATLPRHGVMVSGVFERGYHRGGGRSVNSQQRDRVRAMQLFERARSLALDHGLAEGKAWGNLLLRYADNLQRGQAAWRMGVLTDIDVLPDYDEGWSSHDGSRYAPTDPEGNPVFFQAPASFEEARNDGERWLALLHQAAQAHPSLRASALRRQADKAYEWYDVQTLQRFRWFFQAIPGLDDETRDATFALHTLEENETIARLASGIRRFVLPDEWDYIAMYRKLADTYPEMKPATDETSSSLWQNVHWQTLQKLAMIFENRRQFATAAHYWKECIDRYGNQPNQTWADRLDQIVKPWGQFEGTRPQADASGLFLDYRFRNGSRVSLMARPVDIQGLLHDVKQYLMEDPVRLDHGLVNIDAIGHRLVNQDQDKYLGDPVAMWSQDLQPLPDHHDRRVSIKLPALKPGSYLLTASMKNGNQSSLLFRMEDTAILEKRADGRTFYYVADAADGSPVPKATVEFFGYRVEPLEQPGAGRRRHRVMTRRFALYSDEEGKVWVDHDDDYQRYQWLVTATTPHRKATPDQVMHERFAYMGFSSHWGSVFQPQERNVDRILVITDRPIYRPEDTVHFNIWARRAHYDKPQDTSLFAGRELKVTMTNPRHETVLETRLRADAYGGVAASFDLPEDAVLGHYRVQVDGIPGQGTFRVEEYRTPEFEVELEMPDAPVVLGDNIKVHVRATYYFGEPVADGMVTITVDRRALQSHFYPPGRWDWLYGKGYRWSGYDYTWFPGWGTWGTPRPCLIWPQPPSPPERVAEVVQPMTSDGTVAIEIPTEWVKAMHGDRDHQYTFTAEVTDTSRRTVTGAGSLVVPRKAYRVFVEMDRGHYRVGDTMRAHVWVRTGAGRSVADEHGTATLFRVRYDQDGVPQEAKIDVWSFVTDAEGKAQVSLTAAQAGQYRLSATVNKDEQPYKGAAVFPVVGTQPLTNNDFRFTDLEVLPDKASVAPGETVRLRVNTAHEDQTVLLFVRPVNGFYDAPRVLRLEGHSHEVEIPVLQEDQPGFFVEAQTLRNARWVSEVRQIAVPPASRVLNVEMVPSSRQLMPGEDVHVTVRVADAEGQPVSGAVVLTAYDRAIEALSGGSNVPSIHEHFWQWRRHHHPWSRSSVDGFSRYITHTGERPMLPIGLFGHVIDDEDDASVRGVDSMAGISKSGIVRSARGHDAMMPMAMMVAEADTADGFEDATPERSLDVQIRKDFADTAFWSAVLETDEKGVAHARWTFPDNLTSWQLRSWVMAHGTRVGEQATEVVTAKPLMLRLQTPRFMVEEDEITLSVNVHNATETAMPVSAVLEIEGLALEKQSPSQSQVMVPSQGQTRVDWTLKAVREGEAVVRVKALGDDVSDAIEKTYPVRVRGMLTTEAFSRTLRSEEEQLTLSLTVPSERRPDQSRLEVRYTPTLAGAMLDALPYLLHYPYNTSESVLNRFLPTVIVQGVLKEQGITLDAIRERRERQIAEGVHPDPAWERISGNPVFDERVLETMVRNQLQHLSSTQGQDGGWGWLPGSSQRSSAHATAQVVRGLLVARQHGVALIPGMLERGLSWLKNYEQEQRARLRLPPTDRKHKPHADNMDAYVHRVLVKGNMQDPTITQRLFDDRNHLSAYGKSLLAMTLLQSDSQAELAIVMRNIEQVLVMDQRNQTAWLDLQNQGFWWRWYGSEYETHANYLKLLAATQPHSEKASGVVKYLLNNRRHATYWNATRDTALCVEAMAMMLRASGEDQPDMTVTVNFNDQHLETTRLTPPSSSWWEGERRIVLEGDELPEGKHDVMVSREGDGTLYVNALLSQFTMEYPIRAAGLDLGIQRRFYRLERDDRDDTVAGSHGQPVQQTAARYRRVPLENGDTVTSGDWIEVELELRSSNDYEYLIIEDYKAAGFEPLEQRSGYHGQALGAYVEFRDERVVFFLRRLARGRNSISYRVRAEIPGIYTAMPAIMSAMYDPALKAHSDSFNVQVRDQK